MSIEKLVNKGVFILGDYAKMINDSSKTFVVVGVARGGTSMVAGALHHLGVFLGVKSCAPVFEDVDLANAIEAGDMSAIDNIIDDYNAKHDTWGYKRPSLINKLYEMHQKFRNPIYLFIFKDLGSIAVRNNISMKAEIKNNLKNAQRDYQKIVDFLNDRDDLNGMILSYEKIMANKNNFVNSLVDLIGIENVDLKQIENAKDFIEPNPTQYLDNSRITKGQGNLEQITHTTVSGWAFYVATAKSPEVELIINGHVVSKTLANIQRNDLLEKALHQTGECGFVFTVPLGSIKKTDEVLVKITDDIVPIKLGKNAKKWFDEN